MVHDPLTEEARRAALLVDPGEASGKFLTRLLERFGLAVHRAHSVAEAASRASEVAFDLVLTTYVLPDGDGVTLADRLRPWLKEVAPVILVTTTPEAALVERAFREGVTDVIARDDLTQLETFLHYFLRGHKDEVVGARILLLEDSAAQRRTLEAMLERRGFVVDAAATVAEARKLLGEHIYELFLIDLVLNDESGLALIRQLRRHTVDFVLHPIIVLTGYHNTARKNELYRLGVNDYVVKPPHDVELLARVYNLILMRRLFQQARERERLLQMMAVTDKLTGIPNRHAFEEVGKRYFERAKREAKPLALLMIDIDHFKRINDTFGHPAGDEVLRQVAQTLQRQVRASDFAARYGGEEFVVLLPNCDLPHAQKKAERIRKAVVGLGLEQGRVTVSVGVALAAPDQETLEETIERADAALYEAKQAGRNRVAVAPPPGS